MHINPLVCRFGCFNENNQQHIVESDQPLRAHLVLPERVKINDIYGDLGYQKVAISSFIQLEKIQGETDSALLQINPLPVDTVAGAGHGQCFICKSTLCQWTL